MNVKPHPSAVFLERRPDTDIDTYEFLQLNLTTAFYYGHSNSHTDYL